MRLVSKKQIKAALFSTGPGRALGVKVESLRAPLFRTVEIETVSACNRSCGWCPVSVERRPPGRLDEALFRKLIADLAAAGFKGRLAPHFYGEPLLDKRLPELVAHVHEKLPDVLIELFTNGDYLTEDSLTRLAEAGVGRFMVTSHDGEIPERLLDLARYAGKTGLGGRLTLRLFADEEVKYNRGGLVEVERPAGKVFCGHDTITINYRGDVVLCCQDYFGERIFGNIGGENVVDIWNKREFKDLRDRIRCGDWPLEICRKCAGADSGGGGHS